MEAKKTRKPNPGHHYGWRNRRPGSSPTDASRPHHLKTERSIDERASVDAARKGVNHPLRHHPNWHSARAEKNWHAQPGLYTNHFGILGVPDRAVPPA